jgi:hypothetical protein
MASYHKIVAISAWHRTMRDVIGTTWPARIVRWCAYLLSGGFFYLWVALIDENSTALKDYQLALLVALGVAVSLLVFGFLLNFLWLVPWEIWQKNTEEIADLAERVRPRIMLNGLGPQAFKDVRHAEASSTWGGTRHYVLKAFAKGIILKIENPGALYLIKNRRKFGGLAIIDAALGTVRTKSRVR